MKSERLTRIVEIIESRNVETQEELAELLRADGFDVTQATVSRDIRKLGLTKVPASNGHQKYAQLKSELTYAEKYIRILKECFVSVDSAGNILVIKTMSGMAMTAAAALDHSDIPDLIGCIAGDDTVFAVVKTPDEAVLIMNTLKEILNAH